MSAVRAAAAALQSAIDALVLASEATPATSQGAPYVDQYSSGIHRATFLRAVREGAFPARKVGRRWIARREDIDRWLTAAGSDRTEAKREILEDDGLDDIRTACGFRVKGHHA